MKRVSWEPNVISNYYVVVYRALGVVLYPIVGVLHYERRQSLVNTEGVHVERHAFKHFIIIGVVVLLTKRGTKCELPCG